MCVHDGTRARRGHVRVVRSDESTGPTGPGGGPSGGVRLHSAELDRLDSLVSYHVLDTLPDPAFDAITALAAMVCRTPVAAVTLVDIDRQWSKSTHGPATLDGPRSASFCSDTVAAGAPHVVPDATLDLRYVDNPMVTGTPDIRAYAGVPLIGRDGLPVGALCVIDRRPRRFSHAQLRALDGLAMQVVALLEQGRADRDRGLFADGILQDARDPVRLRRALDQGELIAHYQPLVHTGTGRPHALEALLRWEHPDLGVLPPGSFLPGIEGSALVVPVGRAVLDTALDQLAQLRRRGTTLPSGVAVNVASAQLARPGLARDVLAALEHHRTPGTQLSLEITENTALPDEALAVRELRTLADAGVHIVIDDFGVGWSNLSRTLALPADTLKLDRSLAGNVLDDPRAAAMVASTLDLAANLHLDVVAEGVETEPVRQHLADAGCRYAQGYLFSPPVPPRLLPAALEGLHRTAGTRASPQQDVVRLSRAGRRLG